MSSTDPRRNRHSSAIDISFPGPDTAFRYRFDDTEFDEAKLELTVAGRKVALEPRPIQVLVELLRRVDEVVTRDELLDSVWAGRPTVDNVLANAVSKLKRALGPQAGARLVNLPRTGYRLKGPIERVAVGDFPHLGDPGLMAGQPVPHHPNFVLVQPLGRHGKGNVWLARHAKLPGQQRVFKFASDGTGLRRLKREFTIQRLMKAELGSTVPIVAILDHNFDQAPFCLEFEYAGPDLLEWSQGPAGLATMPLDERLRIFCVFLSALVAAHGMAVIHKDLKPANVLMAQVDGQWTPVIADFGNSQLLDPERVRRLGLTLAGTTVDAMTPDDGLAGTALYLAPELLAGHAPNAQSDIYAAGVMLYQLMAGDLRRPLTTGWERDVDDEFVRADIAAATDGDPATRLRAAAELLDRLQRLDDRRAAQRQKLLVEQRAAEAERRAARVRARRPWVIAAGVAMALGLSASLWTQVQLQAALASADAQTARATAITEFLHRDVLQTPNVQFTNLLRPRTLLEVLRTASAATSQRFANDPLAEAATRRRLADTFMRMASLIDARRELDRAHSLLQARVPANDPELLMVGYLRARLMAWAGQTAVSRQILTESEAALGPQVKLAGEVAYYAARARFELMFAEERFEEALPLGHLLVAAADHAYPDTAHLRADAKTRLAETHFRLGQAVAADALIGELAGAPYFAPELRTAFKVRQLLAPANRAVAVGDYATALPLLHSARQLVLSDPRPIRFTLAFVELDLGQTWHGLGDLKASEQALQSARQLFDEVVGDDHQYVRFTDLCLGFVRLDQGRQKEAAQRFQAADQWQQKQGRQVWLPWTNLGRAAILIRDGRSAEALPLLASIQTQHLRNLQLAPTWDHRVRAERALALMRNGQAEEGRREMAAAAHALRGTSASAWLVDHYAALAAHTTTGSGSSRIPNRP